MCVYDGAELSYTTPHRVVLTIFPLNLQSGQTFCVTQMLSVGCDWLIACNGHRQHARKFMKFALMVSEICVRTDRQTDRHTHTYTHAHTRTYTLISPYSAPVLGQITTRRSCLHPQRFMFSRSIVDKRLDCTAPRKTHPSVVRKQILNTKAQNPVKPMRASNRQRGRTVAWQFVPFTVLLSQRAFSKG